jgi:site-specific recombinase
MFKFIRRLNRSINVEEGRADLHTALSSLDPSLSFEERMGALKRLMDWIRLPVSTSNNESLVEGFPARNIRLRFFLQFLERHTELADYFLKTFQEITFRGSAVRLYCLTGIPENTGFISELLDRVIQNSLPPIHREKDLAELFKLIFTEDEDAKWFESCPEQIIAPFLELLEKHDISTEGISLDQNDALIILGSQLSALGISKQIRRHLNYQHISETSFFKLSMAINRAETDDTILKEIANSRYSLQDVRAGLEITGVSVDLIHHLEKIASLLNRIEMILYLRHSDYRGSKVYSISHFIGRLIRDEQKSLRVKDYIHQNLHMLTRKIVERAADKGDTYIAHSHPERSRLFVAASWAGVLTAFTALMKYWIGVGEFPLLIEGFFFFVNYAVGFLLMQKWHLALSSKQPAYTASALSKKFESFMKTKELSEVILEVRRVNISQLIATVGNLLWVIPIAVLLDTLCYWISGDHIVAISEASKIINKHKLMDSLTLFYAAFTGVLLWFSSIVSGWTENWMVFRGIPTLLKENSLLKMLAGKEKINHFANRFPSRMAGVAGNLSIAFFLASPIIIGKLTGMPWTSVTSPWRPEQLL